MPGGYTLGLKGKRKLAYPFAKEKFCWIRCLSEATRNFLPVLCVGGTASHLLLPLLVLPVSLNLVKALRKILENVR